MKEHLEIVSRLCILMFFAGRIWPVPAWKETMNFKNKKIVYLSGSQLTRHTDLY